MGHMQALLWVGIMRSKRMLTKTHPYSYMKDAEFVWPLVLAWASSALAPVQMYRIECHGAYAGPAAGEHDEVKADTHQDTLMAT